MSSLDCCVYNSFHFVGSKNDASSTTTSTSTNVPTTLANQLNLSSEILTSLIAGEPTALSEKPVVVNGTSTTTNALDPSGPETSATNSPM